MTEVIFQTERVFMAVSHPKMAKKILEFEIENRDFLYAWEAVKPESYFTLSSQKKIARMERREFTSDRALPLWLFSRDNGEVIGKIHVFNMNYGNFLNCVIGYKLSEKYVGKNFMFECLSEVVRALFEDVKMHRIEINVMPRNFKSRRLCERLGFILEGESRKFMEIAGVWEDHLHYVKINEEIL